MAFNARITVHLSLLPKAAICRLSGISHRTVYIFDFAMICGVGARLVDGNYGLRFSLQLVSRHKITENELTTDLTPLA